jgi:hypothetical protein
MGLSREEEMAELGECNVVSSRISLMKIGLALNKRLWILYNKTVPQLYFVMEVGKLENLKFFRI